MAYTKYSLTPADNNAAPPDGAPEGMLPSAVNDTMRDMMAQIRDVGDGIRGGTYTMTAPVITGGSITGSTINNSAIGGTTAAAGKFTTLEATGVTTVQAGTVSAPAITTTGDTNTGIFFPAADTIAFTEGGVESMRIDSSGNVGIGTSSPSTKLHVAGTGTQGITVERTDASTAGLFQLLSGNSTNVINASTAKPISFEINASERMRIDSSGNVGIGTTTPSSTIGFQKVLEIYDPTASTVQVNGGGTYKAEFGVGSNGGWLGTGTNDPMRFVTNNTERMRIDSTGNLLVGTTSGSNALNVVKNQSGSTAVVRAQNTNNTVGNFGIEAILGANCNTSGSVHFAGQSGASAWYLLGNGTTTYSSDARLKKEIETARDGYLEDVCKLRVVKYRWENHDESQPKEIGLIAQEVEEVFPGLVQDDLRGDVDGVTYKTLKGSVIPMMMLKAIQELKATVDAQAARIAALESVGA